MTLEYGKMMRLSGLVATAGLVLVFIAAQPSWAYRLQSQHQAQTNKLKLDSNSNSKSDSSKISSSKNKSPSSVNDVLSIDGEGGPWPPRIPMWGFLPSSATSNSNSQSNDRDHMSFLDEKKSKKNMPSMSIEPALPPDLHADEMDINDDFDEPWLVNLKRSTSSKTSGGLKRTRIYDVPQIECPPAEDGMERFACPTPDKLGRYPCVDDHVLCDGFVDCPGREDEDRQACMFYKTTKAHLDVLADALLRWARGRR